MPLPNAVILAAGRGARMKGQTTDKPKCLVELAGKALLDWQCGALIENGLTNILVVRGYLAEKLVGNFQVADNPRWQESNMVVTLTTAHDWLSRSPCIVSYADIVYHPDHVAALIQADGDIIIAYDTYWEALWRLRFQNPLDDAETFITEQGRLLEIGNKTDHLGDVNGQYMGLLKFTPTGWQQIQKVLNRLSKEDLDRLDMTGLINLLLKQNITVKTVPIEGKWCEVDSEDDFQIYDTLISDSESSGHFWSHDWRW